MPTSLEKVISYALRTLVDSDNDTMILTDKKTDKFCQFLSFPVDKADEIVLFDIAFYYLPEEEKERVRNFFTKHGGNGYFVPGSNAGGTSFEEEMWQMNVSAFPDGVNLALGSFTEVFLLRLEDIDLDISIFKSIIQISD